MEHINHLLHHDRNRVIAHELATVQQCVNTSDLGLRNLGNIILVDQVDLSAR